MLKEPLSNKRTSIARPGHQRPPSAKELTMNLKQVRMNLKLLDTVPSPPVSKE